MITVEKASDQQLILMADRLRHALTKARVRPLSSFVRGQWAAQLAQIKHELAARRIAA